MVLKTLIDKHIKKNKYLYVTFVDFKAAFDSIWQKALFYKLVESRVGGLCINMIINIYLDVNIQLELLMLSTHTKVSNRAVSSVPSYSMFFLRF